MSTSNRLRIAALDRHRKRLFGCSSLTVHTTTPEDGERTAAEFECGWSAHRVVGTTVNLQVAESGAWQFQIVANCDWKTSQKFMIAIVALRVAEQRWKVTKVEKPVGQSLVWKIRAQIQAND